LHPLTLLMNFRYLKKSARNMGLHPVSVNDYG
jgi:hypothetical protein